MRRALGKLGWSPPADQPSPCRWSGLPALLEDAEFRPLVVVGRERQMPLAVLGIGSATIAVRGDSTLVILSRARLLESFRPDAGIRELLGGLVSPRPRSMVRLPREGGEIRYHRGSGPSR